MIVRVVKNLGKPEKRVEDVARGFGITGQKSLPQFCSVREAPIRAVVLPALQPTGGFPDVGFQI
jgi:hypothetical protein